MVSSQVKQHHALPLSQPAYQLEKVFSSLITMIYKVHELRYKNSFSQICKKYQLHLENIFSSDLNLVLPRDHLFLWLYREKISTLLEKKT